MERPALVTTYPVSVGRMDWKTPLGASKIVRKQKDPAWHPPKSVIEEALAKGEEPPPKVVPPGPDNPLGQYALRLNLPGYLIHGTNKPWGVGMRVTHGCVRLLPEHIEQLFAQVKVGTQVHLVNQPVKLGWQGDRLFIEVHPPLEEDETAQQDLLRYALEKVYQVLEKEPAKLEGGKLRQALDQATGVPVAIASRGGIRLDNPLFR
jgi:L,D-transpeptidase ErfK/SrfK